MDIQTFNKLKYYDNGFTIIINELDGIPYEYHNGVMKILKSICDDLKTIFENEYVYDLGINNKKLYIKKFSGTHCGLMVNLGLCADNNFEACSLYLDEMRIS
ncbi:hypothetical protein ACMG5I_02500 [Escherichia coli]|uniref:hypothetical protein n=1 Tax=Escherichia coli TaxID=562 RepID=UPI002377B624|nr:hypothetical protein vBEcoMphAPEC6_00935 [Escherichia phage ph0011]